MKKVRGDQLSRQWRILRQIEVSRNGLTAAEIAELGDISLRTAYRDLDDLQQAGFPLYADAGENGRRWKMVETYKLKTPPPFTTTELLSLCLSEDLFKVFQGTVFHESLKALLDKVTATLPPETLSYLDRMRSSFSMKSKSYKNYGRFREMISQVNQAAMECRTIEIAYHSLRGESATIRRVDPYKIWFYDGTIYFIGKCHLRSQIRTFVVDRVHMLRLTEDIFQIPENFIFEKYVKHSFGVMQDELKTVRIRISPSWARYVGEKTWHESQQIQNLFDGGIEIVLRVAGFDEILQWILSLGPEAEVIEPEGLRDKIRESLRKTLTAYEGIRDFTDDKMEIRESLQDYAGQTMDRTRLHLK